MRRRPLPYRTLLSTLGILVLQSGCAGDGSIGGPNAGGSSPTAVLAVTPAAVTLASLTITPTLVPSGGTATGTVTLTGAAPAGGASVALSSPNTLLATVPPSVTVAAGATTATFAISAGTPAIAASLNITASYGGASSFALLVVNAALPTGAVITSLTITPDLVVGGNPAQGTVTIASAVGSSTQVLLESLDESVATVPPSVTVPAGATTADFTITTLPVANTGEASWTLIAGSAGGTTRSASITTTVPPTGPSITTLTFFPAVVGGGGPVTGLVKLNGKATQGGQVALTSSRPDIVQVPASIVVLQNTSSVFFPVTTTLVGANIAVTITATGCCGAVGGATGTLTVTTDAPPPADVVTIQSATFKPGGRGGTLTVKARSTSATAILTVFRNASTVPTFVLTNKGGGSYEGSFSFSGVAPATVTVKSNLGGAATKAVKKN